MIQTFAKVTQDCHPAAREVFALLESIATKDGQAFAAAFGPRADSHFFANLPGGVQVRDAKKLIEMHTDFFASSISSFRYEEPNHGVGGIDFFMCSVPADVTLPDHSKRKVCIDMTFLKKANSWILSRLINTVVDPSQVALK